MKNRIRGILAIAIAFCVAFTALPMMAGDADAYAAAKKKASKKITLSVAGVSQTSATLRWNKIKGAKGYAVFRNGKPVAWLGKGATSYNDSSLSAGTGYSYQVKSYIKKTKKKKGKKIVKYSYKKKSNTVYATTSPATVLTPAPTNTGGNSGDNGGNNTGGNTGGDEGTSPYTGYKYDVKFINEPYGNGGITALYIDTDNPNRFSITLAILDKDGNKTNGNNYYGVQSSNSRYKDLSPLNKGYISIIKPLCSGRCTFVLYEDDATGNTHKIIEKKVLILDYMEQEHLWRQSVLNKVTNTSMTNEQKMNAICAYILENFDYTKVPSTATMPTTIADLNEGYIYLLSDEGVPYWIQKRANSATSPDILVDFGNEIGYTLRSCFNDYELGTQEWWDNHMKAYSEADGKYYSACPYFGKGAIDMNEIVMFNPDTYDFWEEE